MEYSLEAELDDERILLQEQGYKQQPQRPLEPICVVVFCYYVRSEGQIAKKAVYIAIDVNLDGQKDVLDM